LIEICQNIVGSGYFEIQKVKLLLWYGNSADGSQPI